jgi:hypothetical protein
MAPDQLSDLIHLLYCKPQRVVDQPLHPVVIRVHVARQDGLREVLKYVFEYLNRTFLSVDHEFNDGVAAVFVLHAAKVGNYLKSLKNSAGVRPSETMPR